MNRTFLIALALALTGTSGACSNDPVPESPGPSDGGGDGRAPRPDGGNGDADGATAYDGSGSSSGSGGGGPDAGGVDGASADGGAEAEVEAGCGVPETQLGDGCNTCIETNCDPTWCACGGALGQADGGGGYGCLGYVKCAEECVAADAGSPTDCFQNVCNDTTIYTSTEEKAGQLLLGCLVQYCANDCGQ